MMIFPLRCKSFADYQRALEVAERFNELNPKLPIKVNLVGEMIEAEASDEAPAKGLWYVDVTSSSPARLQHFMDELERTERNSRKLFRHFKAESAKRELPVASVADDKPAAAKKTRKKAAPKPEVDETVDPVAAAIAGNLQSPKPKRARKKKGPDDAS